MLLKPLGILKKTLGKCVFGITLWAKLGPYLNKEAEFDPATLGSNPYPPVADRNFL